MTPFFPLCPFSPFFLFSIFPFLPGSGTCWEEIPCHVRTMYEHNCTDDSTRRCTVCTWSCTQHTSFRCSARSPLPTSPHRATLSSGVLRPGLVSGLGTFARCKVQDARCNPRGRLPHISLVARSASSPLHLTSSLLQRAGRRLFHHWPSRSVTFRVCHVLSSGRKGQGDVSVDVLDSSFR